MEHRWGHRTRVAVPIIVSGRSGRIGAGWIVDVSISGARIRLDCPVGLLSLIDIRIDAETAPLAELFEACVVRRCEEGFAVEWTDLAPIGIALLLEGAAIEAAPRVPAVLLSSAARSGGAPASEDSWARPAA